MITCTICGAEIDVNQPVNYIEMMPYISCVCGWRMYADIYAPDEEPDDPSEYQEYQEYRAAMQGA